MNKWQTLQMFLLFQSLLFVGWTNLFRGMVMDRAGTAGDQDVLTHAWIVEAIILFVIAVVGFFMAIVWRLIAPDYANASNLYSKTAAKYEEGHFRKEMQPLAEREKQRIEKAGKRYGDYATSEFILKTIPAALAGFWVLLSLLVLGWILSGFMGLRSPHTGWMVGASSRVDLYSVSFPTCYCAKNRHQQPSSHGAPKENV